MFQETLYHVIADVGAVRPVVHAKGTFWEWVTYIENYHRVSLRHRVVSHSRLREMLGHVCSC